MVNKTKSRRQELREFAESGRLRDLAQSARLSREAQDLIVDVVIRYCEPKPTKRREPR